MEFKPFSSVFHFLIHLNKINITVRSATCSCFFSNTLFKEQLIWSLFSFVFFHIWGGYEGIQTIELNPLKTSVALI